MYAILKVFKNVGDELEVSEAYEKLKLVFQGELYSDKKALGSLVLATN